MKFVGDVISLEWKQTDDFVSNFYLPIELGFRDNDGFPVNFNNLSFGYELMQSYSFIIVESYTFHPSSEFEYVYTDQDYLYATIIKNMSPAMDYKLKIWANNDNKYFEKVYDIVLPLPQQPYPSWHWDGSTNSWQPPTPIPNDPPPGKWIWDEKDQKWIEKKPASD